MTPLKFTPEHEWLRVEADGTVVLGITEYAQEQLGDIVFVELPAIGAHLDNDTNLVVIESVKAVGEVKLPVGGTVVGINERLANEPELVNNAPLADGWLLRIKLDDAALLDTLMDANAYQAYIAEL